jgi:hypothetical protein
MLKGHCLCGSVRYEIEGRLGPIVYCHCSMCRRASGSVGATNASVRAEEFRIVSGAELVRIRILSVEPSRILFALRLSTLLQVVRPDSHSTRHPGR